MKLLADLHTHSKNSRFNHGKNTIEEMAIAANEMGLVEIGITDHGYAHFFRTTKLKVKQARKIVDEINTWSKTKVLLGIEADIISEDGELDIDNETLAMLDILVVGYHKMIFTNFANFFGKVPKTKEAKQKCTNAFVNCINRYPVTMVSHLDSILTTDLYEIGKACSERGTLVEINNRHTKWTEKQVEDLIASGCMFAVSSDAHSRDKVGDVDKAFEIIRKYNIPSERIANVEFMEEEKSEIDRKYTAYQSVYEQLAKNKKEKEEAIETKKKTEITGALSDEMENALKEIAAEKGLKYQEQKPEVVEEEYIKNMSDEEVRLLRQAEEVIRQYKLKAMQNESADNQENADNEKYEFSDNHPLFNNEFEDKFQSINNVVKSSEQGNLQSEMDQNIQGGFSAQQNDFNQINHTAQPYAQQNGFVQQNSVSQDVFGTSGNTQNVGDYAVQNNLQQPEDQYRSNYNQANPTSASVFDQLTTSSLNNTSLQGLKNLMNEGNSNAGFEKNENRAKVQPETSKPVYKKPEPENFMDSITQTKIGKTVEQPKTAEPKTVSSAPAAKTRGNHGAFIVVDNLIDSDKK